MGPSSLGPAPGSVWGRGAVRGTWPRGVSSSLSQRGKERPWLSAPPPVALPLYPQVSPHSSTCRRRPPVNGAVSVSRGCADRRPPDSSTLHRGVPWREVGLGHAGPGGLLRELLPPGAQRLTASCSSYCFSVFMKVLLHLLNCSDPDTLLSARTAPGPLAIQLLFISF